VRESILLDCVYRNRVDKDKTKISEGLQKPGDLPFTHRFGAKIRNATTNKWIFDSNAAKCMYKTFILICKLAIFDV